MNQRPVDLLIRGASELATPLGSTARVGRELGALRIVPRGAVAVDAGRIVAAGPEEELARDHAPRATLDAEGGTLVPGFVDAHTHPIFATTREDEFELRTRGATYAEIAAAGGGILSTTRGVRAASREELEGRLVRHLDRFLELGTTTVEAKTGYGLSLEAELKCLEVLASVRARHAVDLVPTFLGAHDFPEEYRADKQAYVDLLVREMLPRVARDRLAEYCDVITEGIAFSLEQSRRIQQNRFGLNECILPHQTWLDAPFNSRSISEQNQYTSETEAEFLERLKTL